MADNFDPKELAGLLIPDQSTLDKAMATGNITRVSPAVRAAGLINQLNIVRQSEAQLHVAPHN